MQGAAVTGADFRYGMALAWAIEHADGGQEASQRLVHQCNIGHI